MKLVMMRMVPITILDVKYPEHVKYVPKISEKWEKGTKDLPSPWPKEGIFDVEVFGGMER